MKYRAYTLIELLIAVVILGLLATAVTISIGRALEYSRDTRRKTDLDQISSLLEKYYSANRVYPGNNSGCGNAGSVVNYNYTSKYRTDGGNCANSDNTLMNADQWVADLAAFTSKLPKDPKQNPVNNDYWIDNNPCAGGSNLDEYFYQYAVNDDLQKYLLLSRLENSSDSEIVNPTCGATTSLSLKMFYNGAVADPVTVTGSRVFTIY